MGDVEIISMLISSLPRVANTFAATPGCDFIPAPTTDTFPIVGSSATLKMPTSETTGSSALRAIGRSARGTVKLMSADAPSRLRLVLDDHVDVDVRVGERGEDAARDARAVRDAEERHARLVGGVGDGGDQWSFHGLFLADDKGTGVLAEARSAVDADAVVAGVLDRAQLQHAGAGGGHLEHLLEGDDGELAGVGDDPRVGGEDAGDVGVDLAHLGVQRGGEGDGGGVGAAAAERRDVLARCETPWKPATSTICSSVERLADAVGADVEDPRLGVGRVGDDAGLRAGQRDRLVAEVVDRHRAQRAARCARRWRAACPSRAGRGSGETSSAIAISSSVVLPRADSTATTWWPCSRARDDPARGALEALGVGDRGAAELHDDRARHDHTAPPAGERAAERDLVGVLEVAADRQAGGEAGDRDVGRALAQLVGDVQRGRLAGRRRVGGEHDLADRARRARHARVAAGRS